MERSGKISDELKSFRSIVREIPAEHLNYFLIAGATAMTDIDNVINELQVARDYLQTETERLWRANACYVSLAKASDLGNSLNAELLSVSSSLDSLGEANANGRPSL
jgi:hypothetical protein